MCVSGWSEYGLDGTPNESRYSWLSPSHVSKIGRLIGAISIRPPFFTYRLAHDASVPSQAGTRIRFAGLYSFHSLDAPFTSSCIVARTRETISLASFSASDSFRR